MKFFPLSLVLLITACSSPAEDASERLTMAKRAGASLSEQCNLAGEAADAWLREGNEDRYESAKTSRDMICLSAHLCSDVIEGGCSPQPVALD